MSADTHSFIHALRHGRTPAHVPVIAEIKLHSEKEGRLMQASDVPARVAQYEAGGAACISVVTGHWFGGSLALLEQVRGLTKLPLLRKDFIVSVAALDASRDAGADAVLLTRRLLSVATLQQLAEAALARGLTPFIEVSNPGEAAYTPLPAGCVLAVTNRDIRRRETDDGDFTHSLALAAQVRAMGAAALVSVSGIRNAGEVRALVDAGYDAVLVGTALLRAPDAAAWLARVSAALQPVADEVVA